jgi:hypothetical protein
MQKRKKIKRGQNIQILVSCRHTAIKSGTIICDLSDHFPTFVQMPSKQQKTLKKPKLTGRLVKKS